MVMMMMGGESGSASLWTLDPSQQEGLWGKEGDAMENALAKGGRLTLY